MNLEKKLLASTALFIAAATLAVPTFANDSAVNDGVSSTSADTLPITSITNDEEATTEALDSFVLESIKAIIDDEDYGWNSVVDIDPNLRIGTREDALLIVTDGANVSTSAHLSTVSSNTSTGTITIEKSSTLATKQIVLGGGISGSDSYADGASSWTQYSASDTDSSAAITTLSSDYSDKTSYGIAYFSTNTTEYGSVSTMASGADSSTGNSSRFLSDDDFTIANGTTYTVGSGEEVTITAGTSAIIYGKLIIQNGGSVSSAEDGLSGLIIGNNVYTTSDSSDSASVLVDGTDSSFNVTVVRNSNNNYDAIFIGSSSGDWDTDGGTVSVDISATNGGVFKASATNEGELFVAADGYAYDPQDTTRNDKSAGHSYGLKVSLTAGYGEGGTTGGSIELSIDGTIYLGMGSPAEGYKNQLDVKASGSGSTVKISSNSWNVYVNYDANNLATTFLAEKGGEITIFAQGDVIFGNDEEYLGSDNTGSSVDLKATGEGSKITVTGDMIRAAYSTNGMTVNFTAENGGEVYFHSQHSGDRVVTTQSNIFLGYGYGYSSSTEMNTINVKATGEKSVLTISATNEIIANYMATNITTNFTAEDGGTLKLSGVDVLLGYSESNDPSHDGTNSYVNLKSTGSGSKIEIEASHYFEIGFRLDGTTAEVLAEKGGEISITATSNFILGNAGTDGGSANAKKTTISVKATGESSKIDMSGSSIALNNDNAVNVYVSLSATDSGTLKLTTTNGSGSIYLQDHTEVTASSGGNIELSANATIYLGYSSNGGGGVSVTATGENSKVQIYAKNQITVSTRTTGSTTDIVAGGGGYISMTAADTSPFPAIPSTSGTYVWLGYGEGSAGELNVKATGKDDNGNASKIAISAGTQIMVNGNTSEDFTSNFTASDGGVITLYSTYDVDLGGSSTYSSAGKIYMTATGEGSKIEISAGRDLHANYNNSSEVYVSLLADKGGTIILESVNNATFYQNSKISATNGSSLSTQGIELYSGASISIDGTSTWTGGLTYFYSKSSLSITTGADAAQGTANVSLEKLCFAEGADVTIVIDVASLGYGVEASVAILTAESIIFDYADSSGSSTTLEAGTTITGDDNYSETLDTFISSYVTLEEIGFTLDSWSYLANDDDTTYTLYANVTTFAPEPSMFGLLFGLGALGLVATRRRRQHYRKAALLL